MLSIIQASFDAGLSPLASRIAIIVGDIDGVERALGFIRSCSLADEARGVQLLETRPVLRRTMTTSFLL